MKLSQADRLYHTAVKQFDKDDFEGSLTALFEAIHLRYDLEKPEIKRLIRKKLNIIKELKQRINDLEKRENDRRETLKKYAYEYYLLAMKLTKHMILEPPLRTSIKH